VITLAPNLTEIVYALGSGQRLVGTDDFSDEPAQAKALPKVGGMQPNVEKIVALRPDLVLATTNGNHPNLAPALAAVRIPLFVVRTDRLEDVARAMARIASILDSPHADAPAKLGAAMAAQKRTRSKPPRVLFAVWADPLYVAGTETFSDDLLRLTGAANVVQNKGWPQYSLEALVASPPELFLYPAKSVARAQVDELLSVAPSLKKVRAVPVDENLFTRPGPRVGEAAAELNRIFDGVQ
jgi:iron complex transport system substrate-binding protein